MPAGIEWSVRLKMLDKEKKVRLLQEYADNAKEIARLEKELSFWSARSEHDDEVRKLASLLSKSLAAASAKALVIERAVSQVGDSKLRLLLTYHYLDGLTWEQTADMMHMDVRWVFRLRARALESLNISTT